MRTANQLNLPHATLPLDTVVAVQLLTLFRNSEDDIDAVVDFISQHPALVEETLKRCNSLKFRGAECVTDIFEAVSRLGFYELYSIVSGALMAQGIDPEASLRDTGELQWDALPPLAATT